MKAFASSAFVQRGEKQGTAALHHKQSTFNYRFMRANGLEKISFPLFKMSSRDRLHSVNYFPSQFEFPHNDEMKAEFREKKQQKEKENRRQVGKRINFHIISNV